MVTILKVILVLGLVVVVAIVAGGLFMVSAGCQPTELSKQMRPVAVDLAAAGAFDNKMRSLETSFRNRQRAEAQVTEAEITAKTNTLGLPFKNVQVNFDGKTRLSRAAAVWDYQGFSCPVAVEANAGVSGGQLLVDVRTLQVGVVAVPAAVSEQVLTTIRNQAEAIRIPDWVQEARVTADGVATVTTR